MLLVDDGKRLNLIGYKRGQGLYAKLVWMNEHEMNLTCVILRRNAYEYFTTLSTSQRMLGTWNTQEIQVVLTTLLTPKKMPAIL